MHLRALGVSFSTLLAVLLLASAGLAETGSASVAPATGASLPESTPASGEETSPSAPAVPTSGASEPAPPPVVETSPAIQTGAAPVESDSELEALVPPPPAEGVRMEACQAAAEDGPTSPAGANESELTPDEGPEDEDEVAENGEPAPEAEDHSPASAESSGARYTADITDAELERLWKESPEALGSLSIGFTDAGRQINSVQLPEGPNWLRVDPHNAWATEETVRYITTAIDKVAAEFEGMPPLRVNHLSRKDGGWLRPHQSHQSGRDVDFAFYYLPGGPDRGAWAVRERLDLPRNWAFIRALITETDLQFVLVDRRIIKRLYDYALTIGEDKAWLDSVFYNGRNSLVMHARRHRDHFHVRFYNPRAQELGRRVQPLMPKGKSDYNVVVHRVRRGECLGGIAHKYSTTVSAIRKANGIRGNMIRAGRTLHVPLRGPCLNCPVPPEVIVPPRRLPPEKLPQASVQPGGSGLASAANPVEAGAASATAEPKLGVR